MIKTPRHVPRRVPASRRAPPGRAERPASAAPASTLAPARTRSADAKTGPISDTFFRHIVTGMRNGVLAISRDGSLALINAEAYRIFGIAHDPEDLGRPIAAVLKDHPDVVGVLMNSFGLHHVPNRVEMRLKPNQKVIGYTLAFVRDDAGEVVGVSMFFKDLTRVEQLEERERLRDRLAALGQMAAAIAHEVKNPLAGIEVMAGLLRRKIPESPEAQAVLTDIIKEAKMANAIVQEVLDFVRPIRLQVEPIEISLAIQGAVQLADTKKRQGAIEVEVALPPGLPAIQGDEHQLTQVFTNLLINAYEAMDGRGHVRITAGPVRLANAGDGRAAVLVEVTDDGPGIPPEVAEHVFDPFLRPSRRGLGWAWRSSARSSTRTTAASICARRPEKERRFASRCR